MFYLLARRVDQMFVLMLTLCVTAGVRGQATTMPAPAPPKVGDVAQDFSLGTLDGKSIDLRSLEKTGPVVVIELRGWVGYQCPICTKQVGDFIAHSKPLATAVAHVVLIYPGSADGLKAHAQDFIAGKGLPANFSFVTDPDLHFVNAWGLRWNAPHETAYPSTFVVSADNAITFAKVSHSHRGRATAAEVLDVLKAK